MFYFLYILQNTHTDTTANSWNTHTFSDTYPDTFKCILLHNFIEQANWWSRRRSSGEWAELPARQWIVIYCCHRILFCPCSHCCCCCRCYCIWHSQSEVKFCTASLVADMKRISNVRNSFTHSNVLCMRVCMCVWLFPVCQDMSKVINILLHTFLYDNHNLYKNN